MSGVIAHGSSPGRTRPLDAERPLVVFVGQGLSQADNFDLVRLLREAVPHCFNVGVEDPNDLDQVVAALRSLERTDSRERRHSRHHQLHAQIETLCAPNSTYGFPTTTRLCGALGRLAESRLVVVFTSNVDMACRRASLAHGARWLFQREPHGIAGRDAIAGWFRGIEEERAGFHYIPLHGEPSLVCTGSGGKYYATTDPTFMALRPDPDDAHWNSLTAVGLGGDVVEVRSRVWLADRGYALLVNLLRGSERFGKAADLLLVGCGAGGSARRARYPLESAIDMVAEARSDRAASWHAVGLFRHDVESERQSIEWLSKREFALHRVRDPVPTCWDAISEALTMITEGKQPFEEQIG